MRSSVTRGTVTLATVGVRTVLQITALNGEVMNTIDLLLPPGYSARPAAGASVALLSVLGDHGHGVALGGDTEEGDQISDLAEGEFGFKQGATQMVFRNTGTLEATATTILMQGAGATVQKLVDARFVPLFNEHTHAAPGAPPSQQMAVGAQTTTNLQAS
jgi:phage gp45-like